MPLIKVLHIHTLPIISGSGLNTYLSMKGMNKATYRVDLACAPGGKLIDLVEGQGMRVIPFKNLVQPLHPVKDVLIPIDLSLFLKKERYHIVHTHNSKAGFVGRLAATLARVPVIVHTVHGFAFHDHEPGWRRMLFRNVERLASHWCDRMIFISQPLMDWALQERIVDRRKVLKIYSGIEFGHFHPVTEDEKKTLRKKWGIKEGSLVIGMVSKLWDGKGHEILISAFKELKQEIEDAVLVIVGEGYLRGKLVNLVQSFGLAESVLFTGFQTDVSEIIATFDVVALPSLFEGMGRVLLEAMAMEKPVVASRVGGIPDLVHDGVNGILIAPGSVQELRCGLIKILRNPIMAAEMGKQGRKRINSEFSADMMVRSIETVYHELLEKKGISGEA
jgi:glycosyltransferase involved in cell wall biosynthesis